MKIGCWRWTHVVLHVILLRFSRSFCVFISQDVLYILVNCLHVHDLPINFSCTSFSWYSFISFKQHYVEAPCYYRMMLQAWLVNLAHFSWAWYVRACTSKIRIKYLTMLFICLRRYCWGQVIILHEDSLAFLYNFCLESVDIILYFDGLFSICGVLS